MISTVALPALLSLSDGVVREEAKPAIEAERLEEIALGATQPPIAESASWRL